MQDPISEFQSAADEAFTSTDSRVIECPAAGPDEGTVLVLPLFQ